MNDDGQTPSKSVFVRTQRTAEIREAALEVAVAEMERAMRDDVKDLDQQIGTLRNEMKGTVVRAREFEMPDVVAKRDELTRRASQQLAGLQVDLEFVAASEDATAIRETALDALASDLTPHAARRIGQLALERLRRLVAATGPTSPERAEIMQARTTVEIAYRAYATAHPSGREKVAALERQRAAKCGRESSPSRR